LLLGAETMQEDGGHERTKKISATA
jgi:hypothetical protein